MEREKIKSKNKIILLAYLLLPILLICSGVLSAHPAEFNRETPVVRAVRRVSPAVVNISSEYEVRRQVSPFSGFRMDPFFDSFFKDFFDPGLERRYKGNSLGSGVIIDGKRGFILTNAHVVEKTGTITVVLNDQRTFAAQVVGADPDTDLAVLRIDAKEPLPAIDMGNSDDLMIGETVIAIGNPFGFSHTVTTGVVSALNRSFRADDRVFQDFIQTDASINPGNSGGPLLNINGELIGINTAIYAKAQGIGFAIPINKAKRIVNDLIRYGEVVPAWIGITVQDIDTRMGKYLRLETDGGVLVTSVEEKSPAQKAGIREGDVLMSLASRQVPSTEAFASVMKGISADQKVPAVLWRNQKEVSTTVMTSVFPKELAMDLSYRLLGVRVQDLNPGSRRRFTTNETEGVIITDVKKQSYLDRIGVNPGDIIRKMDDVPIKNIEDFKKAVIKYRKKPSVVLLLQRENQLYYLTVKLG